MTSSDWRIVHRYHSQAQQQAARKALNREDIVSRWIEAQERVDIRNPWNTAYVGCGTDAHIDEMEREMAQLRRRRVERAGR